MSSGFVYKYSEAVQLDLECASYYIYQWSTQWVYVIEAWMGVQLTGSWFMKLAVEERSAGRIYGIWVARLGLCLISIMWWVKGESGSYLISIVILPIISIVPITVTTGDWWVSVTTTTAICRYLPKMDLSCVYRGCGCMSGGNRSNGKQTNRADL